MIPVGYTGWVRRGLASGRLGLVREWYRTPKGRDKAVIQYGADGPFSKLGPNLLHAVSDDDASKLGYEGIR